MLALGPRRLFRVFTLAVAMPAIVAASSHNTAASTITSPQDADGTLPFPDLGVTLKLPKLDSLTRGTPQTPNCKGDWTGRLGPSQIRLRFHVLPNATYDFFEAEDVVETWRESIRNHSGADQDDQDVDYSFVPTRCIAGPVGSAPILAIAQASTKKQKEPATPGLTIIVGALLPNDAWSLRADVWPAPDAETMRVLSSALEKGVTYQGKLRDPRWSDDEATAFWKKLAPESTWKKFEKPVRTTHFIVLTNSTSPGPFAKKLETWFTTIDKAFGVEDLPGRKLLPIVLFRTDDDFQSFYRAYHKMEPKDEVKEESIGIDYWVATSCDNDDDYEHLVDMCKQVLITRLRGWRGTQWFRSGLREYIATKPKERAEALRAIKKGKHTSLDKLLDDNAWSSQNAELDAKGTSGEANYWQQSALWIEFFRDGPWPKDSFQRFLRTVGSVPKGDRAGVIAALETIYGMDISALEKRWVEYFSKR